MLTCGICGTTFRPPWSSTMTEDDAVCDPCFQANFAGDHLRQEPPPPMTLTLTPRQVEAMRQVAQRWHEGQTRREDGP